MTLRISQRDFFRTIVTVLCFLPLLVIPSTSSAARKCSVTSFTYMLTDCVGEDVGYTHEGRIYTHIGSWRDGRPHGKGRLVEPRSMTGIHAEIHGMWDTGRLVRACLDSITPLLKAGGRRVLPT